MTVKSKVIKTGNSLGVRIPANYLKEMDLHFEDDIYINYDNRLKCIIISKNDNVPNELFEKSVVEIVTKHFNSEK